MDQAPLPIRSERIVEHLAKLATFSSSPPPEVTRVLFSAPDLAAREWLQARFVEEGLTVRHDAVGNLFARWIGEDPELPAVATGSHIDAVPHSGRFDGTVGVLGALEAFRVLRESGLNPKRSLEIVVFTAEEPTRFGISCLGSRALTGKLAPQDLEVLRDEAGVSFDSLRVGAGLAHLPLDALVLSPRYAAFLELHIEQGPLLEREGAAIGAVEAIAAPAAYRVRWQGAAGHAGTMLMSDRRDALAGAAEGILAIERAAVEWGTIDTVATVGQIAVLPGALNAVAGSASFGIDLRDIDLKRREAVSIQIREALERIARRRSLELTWEVVYEDPPASCDPGLVAQILESADRLGFGAMRMISRAYHDSLFLALRCPIAMIFIPCRDGRSHCPEEYSSPSQIEAGVRVLADCLRVLAGYGKSPDPATATVLPGRVRPR
ncbi:MAG: M20 family metallo-hydrolase [Methylacidiphilaceae bacterium]|nr:M20 family metallo-hydrolase [Candidatus Methylacidiphilaceae bacterium]